MHRIIRDHLEQVLGERPPAPDHPAGKHLAECGECREAVAAMRGHAAMFRQWRATDAEAIEPRPGFYARVLERIEAQTPSSVLHAVLRLPVWPQARDGFAGPGAVAGCLRDFLGADWSPGRRVVVPNLLSFRLPQDLPGVFRQLCQAAW